MWICSILFWDIFTYLSQLFSINKNFTVIACSETLYLLFTLYHVYNLNTLIHLISRVLQSCIGVTTICSKEHNCSSLLLYLQLVTVQFIFWFLLIKTDLLFGFIRIFILIYYYGHFFELYKFMYTKNMVAKIWLPLYETKILIWGITPSVSIETHY